MRTKWQCCCVTEAGELMIQLENVWICPICDARPGQAIHDYWAGVAEESKRIAEEQQVDLFEEET